MSHTLFVFDLDGTLVDSLPDIASALNHALARVNLAPLPLADVRTCVGEGVQRLAEKALQLRPPGSPDVQAHALADEVRAFYRLHPCIHSRLYPGVANLLQALRRDPARKVAVLTNKPGDVTRALLAALGLADAFDATIGDGDGYPRKPDPAALRALMTRFSIPPAGTLMIGDGIPDLAMARALPCDAAAALWGYTPRAELEALAPRYTFTTPSDLIALI